MIEEHPSCPGCGAPIGVYEPIWRIAAQREPEETSWLHVAGDDRRTDALWHAGCAEAADVRGGWPAAEPAATSAPHLLAVHRAQ